MRKQNALTLLVLVIAFHIFAIAGYGQRLYNKQRDEQAQAALELAQALKNGEIFERQLRNLTSLARKDFETLFAGTKSQIDASSFALHTWKKAHQIVCAAEALNRGPGLGPQPAEIKAALEKLKKDVKDAKDALTAFKKSVKLKEEKKEGEEEEEKSESALTTLFARLGQLDELEKFAEKANQAEFISAKTLATIGELSDIAIQLRDVYDAYTAKVNGFNELNTQLADLRVVLKKVAIQSLQVDEQHWKNIASIEARREADRADILSLISQYKGTIKRMKLVAFDPNELDPAKPGNFCEERRDEFANIRSSQLITDYVKDVVQRAHDLEKDNQEVLLKARAALRLMRPGLTPAQLRQIKAPTRKAMTDFVLNFHSRETLSELEEEIKVNVSVNGLGLERDANSAAVESLLRAIIVSAQRHSASIRDMVIDTPQALYLVAALISRGKTPSRLADLRIAQELHAYSIRKSAVRARAYELTISTGAQRLALFHKGGIKPTDIAQLVFAASNVAITPALLAR